MSNFGTAILLMGITGISNISKLIPTMPFTKSLLKGYILIVSREEPWIAIALTNVASFSWPADTPLYSAQLVLYHLLLYCRSDQCGWR